MDLTGNPTGITGPTQSGTTTERFVLGTGQLDYVHPLTKSLKLETGAKSTLRIIHSDYQYGTLVSENLQVDSSISNAFRYEEQVHAAYAILGTQVKKLGLEAGLRAEQALTGFTLYNTDSTYVNNYFKLFPSAHAVYSATEKMEWRLAYSKRIRRPETGDLNPFTEYANPKRLRRGNPTLQPEMIHSFELGNLWRFKPGSLSSTVYYRRMTNTITRVINQVGGDTVEVNMANMLDGHAMGLELIAQIHPLKWLDLTLTANSFRSSMDASNLEPGLRLINYGVDGRFIATAMFSKRWNFQANYTYQPPRFGPQGRIGARHNLDVALKHTFAKGKANLSLRVSDIFNTLAFNIETDDEDVISTFYRKRESRIAFLTLGYRFGQEEKSKKPKRDREETEIRSGFDF